MAVMNEMNSLSTKIKRRKRRKSIAKTTSIPASTVVERAEPPIKPQDSEKLLIVLYFLYDAFERASLDFFLIRQTAHDAIDNKPLSTSPLTIGIRYNEWIGGNADMLLAFFEQEHVKTLEEKDYAIRFEYQEVPFVLHIYKDNASVTALTSVAYEFETWKIPNQFKTFDKNFDPHEGDINTE